MLALLFGLAVGFGLSTNDEYCFLIGRDFGLFKIDLGLGAFQGFSMWLSLMDYRLYDIGYNDTVIF